MTEQASTDGARGPVLDPMRYADVDDVYRVACACFSVPWSRHLFMEDLSRPFAHIRVLRPAPGARPLAFAGAWLLATELHVLNLATHPQARRCGYARRLMQDMVHFATARRVQMVTLEVRRSNGPAQRLYESLGFERMGVRGRYYADNGEDAFVMTRRLL